MWLFTRTVRVLKVDICLTLQGRVIGCFKAAVADGRVGLEADVHGSLSGLQPGGNLCSTERPQQRRVGCGAVPDLQDNT